jgi:hypothetical protein
MKTHILGKKILVQSALHSLWDPHMFSIWGCSPYTKNQRIMQKDLLHHTIFLEKLVVTQFSKKKSQLLPNLKIQPNKMIVDLFTCFPEQPILRKK